MTKILLISDTRVPTRTDVPLHGLGHLVIATVKALQKNDYKVFVLAGKGSEITGLESVQTVAHEQDFLGFPEEFYAQFDVIIDYSHEKLVGKKYPTLPIVDFSVDRESRPLRNPVFNSHAHMKYWRMQGMVIPSAVDTDYYKFAAKPKGYLLWLSPMYPQKGFKTALFVAKVTQYPFVMAGPGTENIINGRGPVIGDEKVKLLQEASALMFPSPHEAGPTTVLEAMSCGTPVICYNYGGAAEYVVDKETGVVVDTQQEFIERLPEIFKLKRKLIREHVTKNYSYDALVENINELIHRIMNGERWDV